MVVRRDRLRKLLIPKTMNVSGNYHRSTKEKAFAYCLLMHAEIETYLEFMISDILITAFEQWSQKTLVSRPLIAIAAYKDGNSVGFSDDIFNVKSDKKLESVLHTCKVQFDARVGKNHGVRKKDLTQLMMSIGFAPDPKEETLLNSLDGFGSKRGGYAHRSPDEKVLAATDPITEANEIKTLIDAMLDLDQSFIDYKKSCGL